MSTPTSTAHEEAEPIRQAVVAALRQRPVVDDPTMAALQGSEAGAPLLARSPGGAPAFWIVPLKAGALAPGFARVELNGRVAQIGRLGAAVEAAYFEEPAAVLQEIRARHPAAPLSQPQLAYDGSPAKWAWLVKVGEPATRFVFVTPGGWYERPARDDTAAGHGG
jgi:hypothetical protein